MQHPRSLGLPERWGPLQPGRETAPETGRGGTGRVKISKQRPPFRPPPLYLNTIIKKNHRPLDAYNEIERIQGNAECL